MKYYLSVGQGQKDAAEIGQVLVHVIIKMAVLYCVHVLEKLCETIFISNSFLNFFLKEEKRLLELRLFMKSQQM